MVQVVARGNHRFRGVVGDTPKSFFSFLLRLTLATSNFPGDEVNDEPASAIPSPRGA
jgi:hypothetical protein